MAIALGTTLSLGCASRTAQPAWSEAALSELMMPATAALPRALANETARYRLTVAGISLASFELSQQSTGGWLVLTGVTKQDGLGALFDQIRSEFTAAIARRDGALVPAYFLANEPMSGNPEREEKINVEYTPSGADITVYQQGAAPFVERQVLSSRQRFDLGTFLFAIRWLDTTKGQQVFADVFRSRYAWRAQLTDAGAESLQTTVGTFRAKRYDGRSRKLRRDGTLDTSGGERVYSLWISDDADRVLLKLSGASDLGAVELEIVHYGQLSAR